MSGNDLYLKGELMMNRVQQEMIRAVDGEEVQSQSLIKTGSGDFNSIMAEINTVVGNVMNTISTEVQTNVQNLKDVMKGSEAKFDHNMKFQTIIEPGRIMFNIETSQGFV